MAIAFDAATGHSDTVQNPSYTHTCTGSDLILFVMVVHQSSVAPTSVTYNGIAMTLLQTAQRGALDDVMYLYMLVNPSTGSNTVQINRSGASTLRSITQSYTGAKQTSQPDNSGEFGADADGSTDISLTTTADKCWMVCFAGFQRAWTISSGGTERTAISDSKSFDSNAVITPAGTHTMSFSSGNVTDDVAVAATFAPAPEAAASNAIFFGTNM